MARVRRWGRKFTWPAVIVAQFLPIPNAIIYVIAGWAGMSLLTFIILDRISTLLWAGMSSGHGYALGRPPVEVIPRSSSYGLGSSRCLISCVCAVQSTPHTGID